MSNPISHNAVTDICIRIMDFLVPEEEKDDSYDFEAQDELRTILKAWLRQNNIPFEENKMNEELKEYTCTVTISYSGNNHEATSVEDYKEKVKEQFYQETSIKLNDSEISDVEEVKPTEK